MMMIDRLGTLFGAALLASDQNNHWKTVVP
jgi:hypothetical protein